MDMRNVLKLNDGGVILSSRGLLSTSEKVSPHRTKGLSKKQSQYHSPTRYASKNASTLGRESPTGSSLSAENERMNLE